MALMLGIAGLLAAPAMAEPRDTPARVVVVQRGGVYGGPARGPRGYRDATYERGYETGYKDGYERGRRDARDRRYDPQRHRWYRSGDRGYKGKFGPKPVYQQAYRDAFLSGYESAFVEVYGPRRGRPGRRGNSGAGFLQFGFGFDW
jgi:hypothetical protein